MIGVRGKLSLVTAKSVFDLGIVNPSDRVIMERAGTEIVGVGVERASPLA